MSLSGGRGGAVAQLDALGLIGDVHAEDELFEAALVFLRARGADLILVCGDVVDGSGDAGRCCELLAGEDVLAVRGNHDRWFLEGRMRDLPDATPAGALDEAAMGALERLPVEIALQTVAGPLLLCHGIGADDMATLRPDDCGYALETNTALQAMIAAGTYRLMVAGHSHERMVRTLGGLTVINPGTLLRYHRPSAAELDLERREVRFHDLAEGEPRLVETLGLDL